VQSLFSLKSPEKTYSQNQYHLIELERRFCQRKHQNSNFVSRSIFHKSNNIQQYLQPSYKWSKEKNNQESCRKTWKLWLFSLVDFVFPWRSSNTKFFEYFL
jgi:hypothetical protein